MKTIKDVKYEYYNFRYFGNNMWESTWAMVKLRPRSSMICQI